MYGRDLKQVLRGIIDERDDILRGADGKRLKPGARNVLIDKMLWELWMRGYAISARTMNDKGFDRDPETHDAWRSSKRAKGVAL